MKLEDVKVIPAKLGGRFDPNHHEALSYQESETNEHGTILAVISPGYSVEGKVIKPAMVEVAKQKEKKAGENSKIVDSHSKEVEIEEAASKENR